MGGVSKFRFSSWADWLAVEASWFSLVVERFLFDIGGVVSVEYTDQAGKWPIGMGGAIPEARPGPSRLRGNARTGRRSSQEPSSQGNILQRKIPCRVAKKQPGVGPKLLGKRLVASLSL
jgi:hypothetical protein